MKNKKILFLISVLFSSVLFASFVWAQEICIDGVRVKEFEDSACGYNFLAEEILTREPAVSSRVGFESQEDATQWISYLRSAGLLVNPNPCEVKKPPQLCYKGACRFLDGNDPCTNAKNWIQNIPFDGAKISFENGEKMNAYIDELINKISSSNSMPLNVRLNYDSQAKKFTQCAQDSDCLTITSGNSGPKQLPGASFNSANKIPSLDAPLIETGSKAVNNVFAEYVTENGHLGGSIVYTRWMTTGIPSSEKMNIWLYNADTNKQLKLVGNFIPNSQQNYGYAYDMSSYPKGSYYTLIEVSSNTKLRAQSQKFYFDGETSTKKFTSFIVSGYDKNRAINLNTNSNLTLKWSGVGFQNDDIVEVEAFPYEMRHIGGALDEFTGRVVKYKFSAGLNGTTFSLKNFPSGKWVLGLRTRSGSDSYKLSNDFTVISPPKIYAMNIYDSTLNRFIDKKGEVVYFGDRLNISVKATSLDPYGTVVIEIVESDNAGTPKTGAEAELVLRETFSASRPAFDITNINASWAKRKTNYVVNAYYKDIKGVQRSVFRSVPFWHTKR